MCVWCVCVVCACCVCVLCVRVVCACCVCVLCVRVVCACGVCVCLLFTLVHTMQVHTEKLMAEKGIVLPAYQDAVWSYVKGQWDGNNLYIGDHVGQYEDAEGNMVTERGFVGESDLATVSAEQAEKLAEQASLRLLSTLSFYLDGDLDRVDQVVKVVGIVKGDNDFIGHGKVINGASNMLVEALGDRGRHARTCTGAGSLPAAVTIEMIVRCKPK